MPIPEPRDQGADGVSRDPDRDLSAGGVRLHAIETGLETGPLPEGVLDLLDLTQLIN